jgi:hypothetical protein
MRFLWSAGATLALVAGSGIGAGCSGADQSPLGGAYGGTANAPPPNHGVDNAISSTGSANGAGSGSSSAGSAGPSSGASSSTGSSSGGGASGAPSGSTGGTGGSGSSASGSHVGSGSGSSGSASGSASGSSSGGGGSSCDTFSCIFKTYLQAGTIGNCSVACHVQMASASSAYTWLQGQGYMGSPPPLTGTRSCLTWYGSGNMPPGGPRSAAQAVADMNAWAAAGAKNN